MAQFFRGTLTLGATPYTSDQKWVDDKGLAPIANTSCRETAGVPCTITLHGPDGDTILDVAGNGTRFRRLKRVSYFSVAGNGATLILDISGPDEYEEPSFLTIAGTIQLDSAIQSGSFSGGAVVTIYTVPVGYKATLLGGYVTVAAGSVELQLYVAAPAGTAPGQRSIADFKPAQAETIFFGPTAGAPAGDTPTALEYVPFTVPPVLLPGEALNLGRASALAGSYSFRFLLEPL